MRPVEVIAPPGTVVAARPPAAVGAGNVEVSQRVADVCLGALALAVPGRLGAAGQGTMNNVLVGGDGWVYYETVGGGQGGRPGQGGDERRPHRDDEHARHARRSARAGAADPGAPLRVAARQRRRRRVPRRRRHRARARAARNRPRCRSSPSGASAGRGDSTAASRARRARTGCSPRATQRAHDASPTSAPWSLPPVT